jgi:pimeloyl-ACP methyl ester carboxylesterase
MIEEQSSKSVHDTPPLSCLRTYRTPEVPHDLAGYADKVRRHAYKVMKEDLQALRDVGYTENAIFEVTLSVALGAALARLDSGLRALRGDRRKAWGFDMSAITAPTRIWYDPDETVLPRQHAEWLATRVSGAALVTTDALGHRAEGKPTSDWSRLYSWLGDLQP